MVENKFYKFFIAVIFALAAVALAHGQNQSGGKTLRENASGGGYLEISPDYSKIAPHPRLFLTPEKKEKILSQIKKSEHAKKIHDAIIKDAYSLLKKEPVKRTDEGFRMRGGGEAAKRFTLWGYAWIMTGDKVFPERAKRELDALAKFEDWNPKHFLDTSAMAIAYAIAYDRFYDAFDADTKKSIVAQLKKKAFEPVYTRHSSGWFYTAKHVNNWSQVCGAGILCAAISVYEAEPELCKKIIGDMFKTLEKGTLDCFSEQGMYLEGSGYWVYGTMHHAMAIEALNSAFGNDLGFTAKYPRFLNSGKFILHMVGPSGLNYNYSDSGENHGRINLISYFAEKTKDDSVLFWQFKKFAKPDLKYGSDFCRYFVYAPEYEPKMLSPKENFWIDANMSVPVFLGRTGWDDNALFVGVKGGKAASSHGHMDASSFVFDALGERWAFDLGAQNYYSLEKLDMKIWNFSAKSDRWKVFRYNNYSHNMLTVNDSLVDPKAFVKIVKTSKDKNNFGVELDTSPLYSPALKKSKRNISVVDQSKLVVVDSVENGAEKSKVRWNVCSYDNAKILDAHTIEIISPKGAKMLLKLVSPKNFSAKILSAKSGNEWDAENKSRALSGFEGELQPNASEEIKVEMIPQK